MPKCKSVAAGALQHLLQRLRDLHIAVIGDVVLDQFLYGSVDRISPEAPVPVVDVQREVFRLGGAANVVANLRSLGVEVDLWGVVGADAAAGQLGQALEALGVSREGLVEVAERPTAIKTRVIAQQQQVVRFDREHRQALPKAVTKRLLAGALERLGGWDAVVVSDYGKGVVGAELLPALVQACRERAVLLMVDPKPINANLYGGVSCITPNAKETEAMAGLPAGSDAEAEAAGQLLLERHGTEAILVTRGERGMTLVERDQAPAHIGTTARDVYDVTGAGDTTISVLTLARAAGCSFLQSACLANAAAGIVVGKQGTAVVSAAELGDAVASGAFPDTQSDPA